MGGRGWVAWSLLQEVEKGQWEAVQGRNAGRYNYSCTGHPACLYILSPPPTPASEHASPAPHHNTEGAQGRGAGAGSKSALSSHRHLWLLSICSVAVLKGEELHEDLH